MRWVGSRANIRSDEIIIYSGKKLANAYTPAHKNAISTKVIQREKRV